MFPYFYIKLRTKRITMKKCIFSQMILLGLGLMFAQTADWQWLLHYGTGGYEYGYDVCTDANDFVYQVGAYNGTLTLGDQTLNPVGGIDILVTKTDATGNVVWARSAGGGDTDIGYAIAVAANGDVYVHGTFKASATFGTTTLTSGGQEDIFVAKLNSSGDWQWAISASTISSDAAGKIAVDNDGNVYVTGGIWGASTFGSIVPTAYGYFDLFVAKANSLGEWQWVQTGGGTSDDKGNDIAIDADGNLIVVASVFNNVGSFGPFTYTPNHYDVLVAKLNNAGTWQWISASDGSAPEYAQSVAVDPSGAIYVGGYYYTDQWYAPHFGTITPVELGTNTMFVGRMSSSGSWIWVKGAGGTGQENRVTSLAVDANATLWVTGFYYGTASFDTQQLAPFGGRDSFVANMDGAGNWTLLQSFGGIGSDWPSGVATDSFSNAYLTGTFSGTANFGSYSATAINFSDAYLAKYGLTSTTEALISVNPLNLDFGSVFLGDTRTLQVTLEATGTADLVISSIALSGAYAEYTLTLPSMPWVIAVGMQQQFEVTFSPSESIPYVDLITINSNATNHPEFVIGVNGLGEYPEPAEVQNVEVVISDNDALITWDPVTQSVGGTPLTPDRYIVLYNETPYETDQFYYYLASTIDNSFTHHEVALFRSQMFYRVVAVKFVREESRQWLDHISATDKISWTELIQALR